MVRGGKRCGILLALLLASPIALADCGAPVIEATADESSLAEGPLDGDAGDAGDAGDGGDAHADDAGDAGEAGGEDAAAPDHAEEDAAPPPKKPRPTKPVTAGDGGDDASTTDTASTFPDPSTVRLGALPSGNSGCNGAPAGTGAAGAMLGLVMLSFLVAFRRRRS